MCKWALIDDTGSLTDILGQYIWYSLKKREKDNRLALPYKCSKGKSSLSTVEPVPFTQSGRNHHPMTFKTFIAGKGIMKGTPHPDN